MSNKLIQNKAEFFGILMMAVGVSLFLYFLLVLLFSF